MQKLVRAVPFKTFGRSTQPAYNPEANDQKHRSWSHRLNSLSSSGASKVYIGQLSALMNFYTKQVSDSTHEIDWADWKSRITTEGLVDKVQSNYEQQTKEEYELDRIFGQVFNKDSKAIDDINNEMAFHTAIWKDNYYDYVIRLNDLNSLSNLDDYNAVEFFDMHHGLDAFAQADIETNCFFPGAKDDINLYGYLSKQFCWGKKVYTFYRHPADNFNAVKATKNSMGR